MRSQRQVPQQIDMHGARVAVLGYGAAARAHALELRRAGCDVSVGLRLGGMSWVRAREDGFIAQPASVVVGDADVIVVLVPDDEQPSVWWHAIEPYVEVGTLLVFGRGVALQTGAFEPAGMDVVLVTGEAPGERSSGRARVAVHRDSTGRALDRAVAYARAAFGSGVTIGTTTVDAEVDAEIAAMAERAGSVPALVAAVAKSAERVRDNHAPEEAKVAFYEGLMELVEQRATESSPRPSERGSATSLTSGLGPRRGVS